MKILKGEITETRFDFPDGDKAKPMMVKSEQVYKAGQSAYMADELGLHRVSNRGSDYAVSLHCRFQDVRSQGCHSANIDSSVHSTKRGQTWLSHFRW